MTYCILHGKMRIVTVQTYYIKGTINHLYERICENIQATSIFSVFFFLI